MILCFVVNPVHADSCIGLIRIIPSNNHALSCEIAVVMEELASEAGQCGRASDPLRS